MKSPRRLIDASAPSRHPRLRNLRRIAVPVSLVLAAGLAVMTPASGAPIAIPVSTVGGPAPAGLYGWGAATAPDGSMYVGDYWNYRIVHYNADGSPADPFVFAGGPEHLGFGPGTNQAPFGICVDTTNGPEHGDVYMTEGSLFNINAYDSNGAFITSWGTNRAVHSVPFNYPSQCAVSPVNEDLYISNQWGRSLVILDPSNPSAPATFVSPPAPNTFVQPRGLAFDSAGNLWLADQGKHRIDIYYNGASLAGKPSKSILPPDGVSTTFDMRGLAIDTTTQLAFVANGQNCLVQEFNADPASAQYGAFITNMNNVPSGGSNCGTGDGQFEAGARDIAVDGNHQVWVGDLGGFRAEVFDESGNFLFSVPDPAAPPALGGFNGPRGAAFDAAGNLYVSDMFNERIEEFSPGGGGFTFTRAWGMRGDSPGTFNYPRLLCVDPMNQLLIVANTDSNMIVAWNTAPSTPRVAWSSTTGTPPKGTLANPYGVACGADGTVYVANSNGKNVTVYDQNGIRLGAIGSNLGFVRGIWVDSDGSIWVDSNANGNVYHFSAGGTLLSQFNVGGSAGAFGIAGDANYLYIALSSSNKVAQYTRTGTLIGTFGGFGSTFGKMETPQGLTFGPDGLLYVVEEGTNRVSSWTITAGGPPDTVAPSTTITAPAANAVLPAGPVTIQGQATDGQSGVASAQVAVQDRVTKLWWDPTTSSWGTARKWIQATVTPPGAPSAPYSYVWSGGVAGGTYNAISRATDTWGNVQTIFPSAKFSEV